MAEKIVFDNYTETSLKADSVYLTPISSWQVGWLVHVSANLCCTKSGNLRGGCSGNTLVGGTQPPYPSGLAVYAGGGAAYQFPLGGV